MRICASVFLLTCILFLFNADVNWLRGSARVRTGHGKPGKSWNLIISFSRPGKSWNLDLGHGKSWKISALSMSEKQ